MNDNPDAPLASTQSRNAPVGALTDAQLQTAIAKFVHHNRELLTGAAAPSDATIAAEISAGRTAVKSAPTTRQRADAILNALKKIAAHLKDLRKPASLSKPRAELAEDDMRIISNFMTDSLKRLEKLVGQGGGTTAKTKAKGAGAKPLKAIDVALMRTLDSIGSLVATINRFLLDEPFDEVSTELETVLQDAPSP